MMRLRTKFLIVVSILHLVALVGSYYLFKTQQAWFVVSEFFILLSLILSAQLYKQLIRPLQTIADGIEAIKNKDFNVKFLRTGAKEMDRLIDVYNEMMDHLRTERTLQEQQHFFLEKLIYTSPTGILILDFDGKVHQLNPKACAILGGSEMDFVKQAIENINNPLMQRIIELRPGESKTVSPDGVHTYKLQRSHFIDRGFARSFVMMEELTAEILAAEKRAYGKVIRMMAHEVNNTIGPVNSILDSALKTRDLWTLKHETLKHALNVAFERNQNLNIFMRNFADVVRLPEPNKTQTDINQLVRDCTILFEFKAADAGIKLLFQVPDQPFMVLADKQQLEQALINIIQNAVEAVEKDGIILIVSDPGSKKLSITDSGHGISNEHAPHLFSPFYSTKKDGQGVGLTLVKEILLNHGFPFSLNTVEKGRTVFEIEFRS